MSGFKQQNKPHKPGRRAGLSARQKHKTAKEGQASSVKSYAHGSANRQQRQNTAKQIREHKRSELLAHRRNQRAPIVAAVLALSQEIDTQALWNALLAGCHARASADALQSNEENTQIPEVCSYPMLPKEAVLTGPPKQQVTLLPPLPSADALSIVDLGGGADVILLAFPGDSGAAMTDAAGLASLAVLRALGLPTIIPVALVPAAADLKERAQVKKAILASLAIEVPGDHKVHTLGSTADAQQLLRHMASMHVSPPMWRRQRPSLLVQGARMADESPDGMCSLWLQGYVRTLALSVNQLVHVPLAGDFQLSQICSCERPHALGTDHSKQQRHAVGIPTDMETEGPGATVLATADPEQQETLIRENEADTLAGEQTWPTEEELMGAATEQPQRRLPRGTSEYQAAWIVDDEGDEDEFDTAVAAPSEAAPASHAATDAMSQLEDEDDAMGEGLGSEVGTSAPEQKQRWRKQQDDATFPDEIDTPSTLPARQRFAKYRGLKSWRTSPWDPMESLPRHFSRLFAFQNPKRARARAVHAAEHAADFAGAVLPGTYVEVCVCCVPRQQAMHIIEQVTSFTEGRASPLVVRGLLQHETKLSVLNFSIKKAADCTTPVINKATLVLTSGMRTWEGSGVLSTDEPSTDKHKMERFLHPGRQCILSTIAPIAFGPLPLLAFLADEAGHLQLAASGSLQSCNPNRVVLKKITLSGYPVRVHKLKAVVRWMFHAAEDVRWFRPLGLWTKRGRHGHIREPIGTHGAMKCIFDAALSQQDTVCASLYKRAFPKWPGLQSFAFQQT